MRILIHAYQKIKKDPFMCYPCNAKEISPWISMMMYIFHKKEQEYNDKILLMQMMYQNR